MKTISLLPVALFAIPLGAAQPVQSPLPDFSSNRIGLPPLSLGDITRGEAGSGVPRLGFATPPPTSPVASARPSAHPTISRMPVLEPNPNVDYEMLVQPPDSSVDFKLLVRKPEVAPAK